LPYHGGVKAKILLPVILMVVFALSRWPGLMPWNFSAAYALMFCAGVYFPKRLVWWLPFVTMLVADTALNWYHHTHYGTPMFSPELISNYVAYVVIVWLGRMFGPKARFLSLLAGGILGAILFYLITNTFSWIFNPEYLKTFGGWLTALTKGTAGYPQTWEFFEKTLTSGGLFTGLFAGAMKFMEALGPAEEETEEAEEPAEKAEPEPEKAEA
jgi:hypothetical protein